MKFYMYKLSSIPHENLSKDEYWDLREARGETKIDAITTSFTIIGEFIGTCNKADFRKMRPHKRLQWNMGTMQYVDGWIVPSNATFISPDKL